MLTGRDPLELRAGSPARNLRKLLDQMLDPDPQNRPANIAQVKKCLSFIQNRVRDEFIAGMAFGAFLGLGSIFAYFSAFSSSANPWFFMLVCFLVG